MSPRDLLAESDGLLTTVIPGTRGRWPRACAWLIRLALEQSLDAYWAAVLPEARDCSMRAQLLLLPRYAGEEPNSAAGTDLVVSLTEALSTSTDSVSRC